MFRWSVFIAVLSWIFVSDGNAQSAPRPVDPVFVRAQELVSDGNGAAGRALVDSVLKANSPSSQMYPQALFWRASLAASAADAESDYKHIVVDYPLAPQAEDALLRLAQLELARGDRDAALGHLQRIPRDYPRSRSLARASYWTARVLFEKNDIPNACAANANALSQVGTDEVELQNQIQYQGQRCASYNAARTAAATATDTSAGVRQSPLTSKTSSTTPTTASSSISSAPAVNPPSTSTSPSLPPRQRDSVTPAQGVPAQSPAVARPKPPIEARDAKPSIVEKPSVVEKTSNVPAKTTKSGSSAAYTVQVAAYNKRGDADKLVASLKIKGYDARVDGVAAPFRVRIGRYPSEHEAEVALAKIKAKHMEGFVTRAPER